MVSTNVNISRVCSFYVSEWHFVTMLLPHINKIVDEGAKITTFLENSREEQVETLLKKLRLPNSKKIADINWDAKNLNSINMEKIIKKDYKKQNIEIIIAGTIEYINKANELIELWVEKNKIDNKIKIINCYMATEKINMPEILNYHNAVLNTAGEKSIKDFKKSISMM